MNVYMVNLDVQLLVGFRYHGVANNQRTASSNNHASHEQPDMSWVQHLGLMFCQEGGDSVRTGRQGVFGLNSSGILLPW